MADPKQFDPSAKRLKKAIEDGKTPKGKLLPFAGGLISLLLALEILVPSQPLIDWPSGVDFHDPRMCALYLLKDSLWWVGSALGSAALVSMTIFFLQTKGALATKAVRFDVNALNPTSGFTRIFSELKKVPIYMLGLASLLLTTFFLSYQFMHLMPSLLHAPSVVTWTVLRAYVFKASWTFCGIVVFFGLVEVVAGWRKFRREFGMSLQDLKEEHREDNGDPHMRAERRALQEALSFEELPRRVKKAKVIIAALSKRLG